ncbi:MULTISPECIES: hypothetical protein [Streptomyces]|uniref:Uncharacterized protein n=1 Tax=Streptomyces lichenis TaxID=2306967 RepID=A0ABT0IB64_9ACTN|nr:hypothetical protein [Streptomyces lichenis]MCK8678554.1 hypothetical protein [Streptomyces lichenis]
MTTARHLATIDRLRALPFPRAPGPAAVGEGGGPGYHLAELRTTEERYAAEEQYAAERDALAVLLGARWGAPQAFSLWSLLARAAEQEEIPEPWATLSRRVPDVDLWRADDRWIAIGVCRWYEDQPCRLVVAVTTVDPP